MSGRPSGKYGPEMRAVAEALPETTWVHVAEVLSDGFPQFAPYNNKSTEQAAKRNGWKVKIRPAGIRIDTRPIPEKLEGYQAKTETDGLRNQNKELVAQLAARNREVEAALRIRQTPQEYTFKTKPTQSLRTTQVIMWSDWHSEEIVKPDSVNHLNEFNERVADARIQACINNSARLMEITAKDAPVDGVILHLGGDFISGNIHTELLENSWARPVEAILWVQQRLMAGIRHLASKATGRLLIVCNVGNHSRITARTHFATEQGNSLEYMAYHNMRLALADLKNVDWVIAEGYHVFVDLYGKVLRFHHGHAIKYGGGIGGVFIPTYKAISQWNKARRADLDCFGHFHALKNGGNFICNGSLVGYNSFAVAIKADFERPYQKFFLYTNTGEVCGEYPIFLD